MKDDLASVNKQQYLKITHQSASGCGGGSETEYGQAKWHDKGAIKSDNGMWPSRTISSPRINEGNDSPW